MQISPDLVVYWRWGSFGLNATIFFSWVIIILIAAGSWLVTRRLRTGVHISKWQNVLEIIVSVIQQQLAKIIKRNPNRLIPFVGTLFLFIGVSNVLSFVPGFHAPTGSLSTTAALAITVFLAVPVYGISEIGTLNYLRNYIQPTFIMLPFNIIGEISRTLALAVRLFGNVMSGSMIGAILLTVAPVIFPVLMHLLGLLTGIVQAYIFAVLATVYIAAGMQMQTKR